MEVIVPVLLLGSAYVLSNNDKQSEKHKQKMRENFQVTNPTSIKQTCPINQAFETENNYTTAFSGGNGGENMNKTGHLGTGKHAGSGNGTTMQRGTSRNIQNSVNYYSNPNAPIDKLFNVDVHHGQADIDNSMYRSLTGDVLETKAFKHNNMVPYFGSRVKNPVNLENNENRLDNMVGSGSQQIRKQEQAPLFKPH
jgi:hypothetical protein